MSDTPAHATPDPPPDRAALTRGERLALVRLMRERGPDAVTLCEGWTVLDLAAHLVVRERRPDTLPGLGLPPLASWTERVRRQAAAEGLEPLLARIAQGPPPWSPFALPGADARANFAELVVHHEDVRRAGGDGPRTDVGPLQVATWQLLTSPTARLVTAGSPVGIVAVRPDGQRRALKRGEHPVVLTGEPVELLLLLYGRGGSADVEVSGPELSVQRFESARLGI